MFKNKGINFCVYFYGRFTACLSVNIAKRNLNCREILWLWSPPSCHWRFGCSLFENFCTILILSLLNVGWPINLTAGISFFSITFLGGNSPSLLLKTLPSLRLCILFPKFQIIGLAKICYFPQVQWRDDSAGAAREIIRRVDLYLFR